MRSNGWQTLIVTSAGPGEGKTMTACNLAISISADVNQAVVLADLDLQRPSLASRLGLEAEVGISDYLLGHAELKDIVYRPTGMDRIAVIPNLRAVPHSSELLSAPRMRTLVEWLNSQGPETISIFDTPPVLACDDVLAFSPFADAILMVVAEGKAERISLARSMELMADRNILGVVLNQTREKSSVSSYY
jgi:Mrp family chromosome partitioning ATPase